MHMSVLSMLCVVGISFMTYYYTLKGNNLLPHYGLTQLFVNKVRNAQGCVPTSHLECTGEPQLIDAGHLRPLGFSLALCLPSPQGGLAHLPIGIARPLCTSGAFPILFLPTEVTTDNCPFTFPLPPLPPPPWQSSPLPPALCPLPAYS